MTRIDELWVLDRTPEENDEFDVLVVLAEAWEDQELVWPSIEASVRRRQVLENLIEHRGVKTTELAKACGGLSRVEEILDGKRPLTDAAAREIASAFRLDLSLFG